MLEFNAPGFLVVPSGRASARDKLRLPNNGRAPQNALGSMTNRALAPFNRAMSAVARSGDIRR